MPKYDKKICVCTGYNKKKSNSFGSYEELIEWANEEISKNKEIKVGDIVTIEKYGDMYDTLDVAYFQDLWNNSSIDGDEIYKLMIHYAHGTNYGTGFNHSEEKNRVKWKVLFIHNERVFIERHDAPTISRDPCMILCVKKSGLRKFEEV